MLHSEPMLEKYRSTQPLRTILFRVLLVSVLYELSFSLLPHCLQPEWAWFQSDGQSQSRTDVLAPLVIMDLKHRLQKGFVVSVGLPLLSAT